MVDRSVGGVSGARRTPRRHCGARPRRGVLLAARPAVLVVALLMALPVLLPAGPADHDSALPAAPADDASLAAPESAAMLEAYASLPLRFEENQGQTDPSVRFLVRSPQRTDFFTSEGMVTVLTGSMAPTGPAALDETAPEASVVRMHFDGGDPAPMITSSERLPGASHSFIGNDPDQWVSGIPGHARIQYHDVWPGIDVVFYGDGGVRYDFVVAPGADPADIRLRFEGMEHVELEESGALALTTTVGIIRHDAPFTYQEPDGAKVEVPSAYRQLADGLIGFSVGRHDPALPLVIDPLVYATYLGGSGTDRGLSVVADSSGNAYVTGSASSSTDFPTTAGAYRPAALGLKFNAFVTKLDPVGSSLVYSTYLGGSDGYDYGLAIALDGSGNAYITGETGSMDFPTTVGAYQTSMAGPRDAFVTKLNAGGSSLDYSTYLGGVGNVERGHGIAVDASGNAYVTGEARNAFPTTAGAYQTTYGGGGYGNNDAFVAKLNAAGSSLLYSTYLGGGDKDAGWAIAVDAANNAYVTGGTESVDFPTTPGAFQTTNAGGSDTFVTKLSATGSSLVYSTYLGGNLVDAYTGGGSTFSEAQGGDIAVDASGNAYVAGSTKSTDFPTTSGAFQTVNAGNQDAFVSKLNPAGASLIYSTYLGGSNDEWGLGIAVGPTGRAFITGSTTSSDHPVTAGAYQTTHAGEEDAFISILGSTGTSLAYSTYLGGSKVDAGVDIAVDPAGVAYAVGRTLSLDYPTTTGVFQGAFGGSFDAWAVKLDISPPVADFEWTPEPGCAGVPVVFTDLSTPNSTLAKSEWDFGDGATTTLDPWASSTTHTYAVPGGTPVQPDATYTVTLTVWNTDGTSATVTKTLTQRDCRLPPPPPPPPPPVDEPPRITAAPSECAYVKEGMLASLRVEGMDPDDGTDDPPDFFDLEWALVGAPGGSIDADGRYWWRTDASGRFEFTVVLREVSHPSMKDEAVVCVLVDAKPKVPQNADADGDGHIDGHDPCPASAGAGGCTPVEAVAQPGDAADDAPCEDDDIRPSEVRAHAKGESVEITWRAPPACQLDRFLVWNGTSGHLVAVVRYQPGVEAYSAVDEDAWWMPHRYYVQAEATPGPDAFRAAAAVPTEPVGMDPCASGCPMGLDDAPQEGAPVASTATPLGMIASWWWLGLIPFLIAIWRLGLPLLRMFSRLDHEKLLENATRARIHAVVAAEPGIHYKEIIRRVDKAHGLVRHHLKVLVAGGVLQERATNGHVCFYLSGATPADRKSAGLLRSEVAQSLLERVRSRPGLTVAQLAHEMQVSPQTIRYHLHRFEEAGLIGLEPGANGSVVRPLQPGRTGERGGSPSG